MVTALVAGGRKGHRGAGHLRVWKGVPATTKRSSQNRKPGLNPGNSEDIRVFSLGGWGKKLDSFSIP